MSKHRVVTDGERFWIQSRIFFIWTTLNGGGGYSTQEEAERIIRRVWPQRSKFRVVSQVFD